MKKYALIDGFAITRADVNNSQYLTPRQKAFLNANLDLRKNTKKGKKSDRNVLGKKYDVWEADMNEKYSWESVESFAVRALEQGIAKKVDSFGVDVYAKEIERNTYTEHIFDDGTVVGEVERLTWY